MRGRCLVCGWPEARLVERVTATEGICWWCKDDGWKAAKEARA